ncbi:ABC transporter permease [Puia dinghuensis]|uniref:ABC transporter permease n=1 Tax=Puia dinghuensis TaxID=1792502 RepID=A0A8J2XU60_9BACT|nr:ABC transporter permease [Puia dinghuensis]GGB23134.1 ABC transporter permease [Puia dinghuensis]
MPTIHTKLAFRQLTKNRTFTLLNILGLTLGLATFLLIVLYVTDELGFDRFNTNADRIVRLNTDIYSDGKLSQMADAAPPVAPTLIRDYPEVEAAARCLPENGIRFRLGSQDVTENHVATVDPAFFSIFTLPALDGDAAKGLQQPRTAVLTATAAQRYFNTTHAVGRTLTRLDDTLRYKVVAVIADLPAQASFHYDIFLSIIGNGMENNNSFFAIVPMATFVLLKPGANRAAFDKHLSTLMRHYADQYAAIEDDNKGNFYIHINEIPLTDIHLRSHRTDELATGSDSQYVYIFSAIAVFVLLIAGINFMNLSTARSANRAREVGVRKVLGSARGQLIGQFLIESLLLTAAAALIAISLVWLVLPWFNDLTGKNIALDAATLRWLLPALAGIIVTLGGFSGAYPAFFLSAFRPVQVLKGRLALGGKGGGLRSALVVGQFTVSIFLIVGTLAVYRQLHFIQHRDPGFDRSQVLIIKDIDGIANPAVLKQQMLRLPGVSAATLTDFLPAVGNRWHNWGNVKGNPRGMQTELWVVDEDYIPTMGMHVVGGRNFSHAMSTDSNAIIINETAARKFGIEKDPLGKIIHYESYWHHPADFTVIGIIRDFNFTSIRSAITPLVLVDRPGDNSAGLNIRMAADHIPDVLARVKATWSAFAPQKPFHYSFLDEDFDSLYRAEQRMGSVVIVLTTLAIFIACLGLFGLAAYGAEQRAKEIGIRKILGAGIPSIITLLSKDFARLIALAIVIATPLAWWSMHRWLDNFAYRTTLSPWLFAAAAGIVISIAALTTLFQSLKAAVVNPVDALRSE